VVGAEDADVGAYVGSEEGVRVGIVDGADVGAVGPGVGSVVHTPQVLAQFASSSSSPAWVYPFCSTAWLQE